MSDEARSSWGYRVIVTPGAAGPTHAIYEVYFRPDGVPFAWGAEPSAPEGRTADALRTDIERIAAALELPWFRVEGDDLVELRSDER